jgi:MFS family permease
VPASSQVLQRFSPAPHRSLIFSIKQGSGAIGGVFAGLAVPAVASFGGWRGAVLMSLCMVLTFAVVVQPLRHRADDERDRTRRLTPKAFLSPENLTRTIRALQSVPGLLSFACAGGLLGLTQGCWNAFLVTFLVNHLGYSIGRAGAIFAVMQIATFIGRMFMGWLSDRLGSGVPIMRISAIGSFLVTAVLALASPTWPFWTIVLLSFTSGVAVSGWNGVNLAEATLRVPVHLVGEASAGSIVVVTLGQIVGPMAFGLLLYFIDRFDIAFVIAGAVSLFALLLIGQPKRPAIKARAG